MQEFSINTEFDEEDKLKNEIKIAALIEGFNPKSNVKRL